MAEAIIWKPEEVWDELKILGLDYEGLVDCVRYAEQERSFVRDLLESTVAVHQEAFGAPQE